jgi:hypothetical protein
MTKHAALWLWLLINQPRRRPPRCLRRYPGPQFQCRDSAETIYGRVLEAPTKDSSGATIVRIKCLNGRVFLARLRATTAFVPMTLFDGEVGHLLLA